MPDALLLTIDYSPALLLLLILAASAAWLYIRNRQQFHHRGSYRRQQTRRQILKAVIRAQDEERARIGRDLHDDLGSPLAALKLTLGTPAYEQLDRQTFHKLQSDCTALLDRIGTNLRRIAHNQSPLSLDLYGLPTAIEELVDDVRTNTSLNIVLRNSANRTLDALPPHTALALFRVIEELLANTIRHAGAAHIWLTLAESGASLLLHYHDDGCGIAPTSRPGMGLNNIRMRLQSVGAQYHTETSTGKGYSITIRLDHL